jgi:type IV pilus assembly protein PilM
MMRISRSQFLPIGVDLGFDSVKLLQLEQQPGSLAVASAVRLSMPEDAPRDPTERLPVAVGLVRQALEQHHFHGRKVICTLPREIAHVKNLRLPPMPLDELGSAVQFEAQTAFPFDVDRAAIRFLPAGEVRSNQDVRQEVLVVGVKNDDLLQFLEQIHHSGAQVDSLDFEPCALYRLVDRFIRRKSDEQEVNVILDVGARRSQIVIGRGREISFYKSIEIGGLHLNTAVAEKLGITVSEAKALRRKINDRSGLEPDVKGKETDADPVDQAVQDATRARVEDLAREVSLCVRYYLVTFRGHRPHRVRLVGGEAADSQLRETLNAALTIPVEASRPLLSVDTRKMNAGDRRGFMSEWGIALGLAMKRYNGALAPMDGIPRSLQRASGEEAPQAEQPAREEVAGA